MNEKCVVLFILCCSFLYGCSCSPLCSPFPLFFPVPMYDGMFVHKETFKKVPDDVLSECEGKAIAASVSSKAKSFDQFFRETGLNWVEAYERYPLMFQSFGKCLYEKGYFYNSSIAQCLFSPEQCKAYAKYRKWYWLFWTH